MSVELPDQAQLMAEYRALSKPSLRALAKNYDVSAETMRRRLRGVDLRAARVAARREAVDAVVSEGSFRIALAQADGIFTDLCKQRGVSRHRYLQALRAGGVTAERQAQIIDEVRRQRCLAHYDAAKYKLGRHPSSFELQRGAQQWLYKRIVRAYGSWEAFERSELGKPPEIKVEPEPKAKAKPRKKKA